MLVPIVAAFAVFVTAMGLSGIIAPTALVRFSAAFRSRGGYLAAIAIRLAAAAAFWFVAPQTRQPVVFQAIAVLAILAAITLIAIGQARTERLIAWFIDWPPSFIRGWAAVAVLFGAYLLWALSTTNARSLVA
jgi:hypothetical protein